MITEIDMMQKCFGSFWDIQTKKQCNQRIYDNPVYMYITKLYFKRHKQL